MRRSKSDYVIQTVANALRLLEEFREGEPQLGVTELARRLSLHKNNVFRMLATLEQQGYVEQCAETEEYRLGRACLGLGHAFTATRSLSRFARPVLAQLARACGESAHLGVLSGVEVVHLDGEQPLQLVSTMLRTGGRLASHCTALGKVLLAGEGRPSLEQLDKSWERARGAKLEARTAATITDREKLLEHLRGVASQGYAIDQEECERGLCCVAAPVHGTAGAVVAALSVSLPVFRADESRLHDVCVPLVTRAAGELSRRLGAA